ncbi:hypothetical protein BVU76_16890 [Mycolicibacterium porcinum]|nr:hypothetical protein BVU76_16890 [Mycolicibacterium porcinum]
MHSERFRILLNSRGPYGSVYFDDSHDTADAAGTIELKWRALRAELERQGAGPELLRRLELAVTTRRPAVGRGSRIVVANADGVLVDQHLSHGEGQLHARVSELPYILPTLETGTEQHSYLVVIVDHAGADIELHGDRPDQPAVVATTVEGGSFPVHKAGRAETLGYGDPQQHTEESRSKNIRAVADRVTAFVDDEKPDAVFVVGEVRSRNDLAAALPERVTKLVVHLQVGARHSGFDPTALNEAVTEWLVQHQHDAVDAVADDVSAEIRRGSGRATEGLPGVCAALRAGAVDTLLVGDIGDATVVSSDDLDTVAPNPEVLSELGVAPTRVLRADEALPMRAISTGADLAKMPAGYSATNGVAALLRYAPRQPAAVT